MNNNGLLSILSIQINQPNFCLAYEDCIRKIALIILDTYVEDKEWEVGITPSFVEFGMCSHKHKVILLSHVLIYGENFSAIMETIYHEIAHACTNLPGHDSYWEHTANTIAKEISKITGVRANKIIARENPYFSFYYFINAALNFTKRLKTPYEFEYLENISKANLYGDDTGYMLNRITNWLNKNENYYIKLMYLNDWKISTRVYYYPNVDKNDIRKRKQHFVAACDHQIMFEYKIAVVQIIANYIDDIDDLRHEFIHELAHVMSSSFILYSNSYNHSQLRLKENEQKAVKDLEYIVSEILALRIEMIILSKHPNIIRRINNYIDELEDYLIRLCSHLGWQDKNIIITDPFEQSRSVKEHAFKIVEDIKNEPPEHWFDQWKKYDLNIKTSK